MRYTPGDENIRSSLKREAATGESGYASGLSGPELMATSRRLATHMVWTSLKATTDGVLVAASSGADRHELDRMAAAFLAMWPGR
ncbi:hypothetical protein [Halodurantibacterium flavum]|uniref:TetR family transcriptional regulator n=1 Tax=Halodurantibacterium flavum TaxID=1382802 RepID=A0ABW4S3B9_9RHOB